MYYHPTDNCTSFSVDTLRALGLEVQLLGPTARVGALYYSHSSGYAASGGTSSHTRTPSLDSRVGITRQPPPAELTASTSFRRPATDANMAPSGFRTSCAMIAATAGVWLFYVQHQFEDTYWEGHTTWEYASAALEGSSYYRLPRVLEWMTGSIGLHHLHHADPRIPNYNLRRCHDENPMFHEVTVLTVPASSAWSLSRLLRASRQRPSLQPASSAFDIAVSPK